MKATELVHLVSEVGVYGLAWGIQEEKGFYYKPIDQSLDNLIHTLSEQFHGNGFETKVDPSTVWDWPEVWRLPIENIVLWATKDPWTKLNKVWRKTIGFKGNYRHYVLGDPRYPNKNPPRDWVSNGGRII